MWEPPSGEETGIVIGAMVHSGTSEGVIDGTALLSIRLHLVLQEPECSVDLDCAVTFEFGECIGELAVAEAVEFARTEGLQYTLGYLRGGLADARRSVGLNAAMFPSVLPAELVEGFERSLSPKA
ncbi:hypothetical protein GCM10023147_45450 [Tsukamurella soli]|uniref:Uncharacterized protein n=2 Tax=Tsukamurella soli TaxID=644556 RepID=A0ABP8KBF0_9ACTN